MNKQYYTKTELTRRWTKRLVDKFFPQCSEEVPNPRNKKTPIKLYDVNKVNLIETLDSFKPKWEKLQQRRFEAMERDFCERCYSPPYISHLY